ncbi:MAG: hypothetical protein ABI120_12610 [Gemmatimonadaceae bacterium]
MYTWIECYEEWETLRGDATEPSHGETKAVTTSQRVGLFVPERRSGNSRNAILGEGVAGVDIVATVDLLNVESSALASLLSAAYSADESGENLRSKLKLSLTSATSTRLTQPIEYLASPNRMLVSRRNTDLSTRLGDALSELRTARIREIPSLGRGRYVEVTLAIPNNGKLRLSDK